MTRLDDLLGQLAVDVPEAPTVDELRRRAGQRHRRLLPMVAILIGLVVISTVLVQVIGDEGKGEGREGPSDDPPPSEAPLLPGPRSFEISIDGHANPVVRTRQFDMPRWDWITDEFPALGIRLNVTSSAALPVVLTPPTWERATETGVLYMGNGVCDTIDLVCVVPADTVTLLPLQEIQMWVYVQPRLMPLEDLSFSTQLGYEVPLTGERGTIPVDVSLRAWTPDPGTEPVPDPITTIIWPPPSTTP